MSAKTSLLYDETLYHPSLIAYEKTTASKTKTTGPAKQFMFRFEGDHPPDRKLSNGDRAVLYISDDGSPFTEEEVQYITEKTWKTEILRGSVVPIADIVENFDDSLKDND